MARKATQTAVLLDIGKHDFNRLSPQAVHRLCFSRLHPGPVRDHEVFVLATLHTSTAFFARGTLITKGASLTGLGVAAIGPLHDFTPATARALVVPAALEQLAGWAGISIEGA